jgi:hypothetical protein
MLQLVQGNPGGLEGPGAQSSRAMPLFFWSGHVISLAIRISSVRQRPGVSSRRVRHPRLLRPFSMYNPAREKGKKRNRSVVRPVPFFLRGKGKNGKREAKKKAHHFLLTKIAALD